MVKFHFDIQQKHIDAGLRGSEDSCPVALAIKEAGHECSVGEEIVIDGKKFGWPQSVSDFVGDFDGGFGPTPFSFDLTDEHALDPDDREHLIEEDDASL